MKISHELSRKATGLAAGVFLLSLAMVPVTTFAATGAGANGGASFGSKKSCMTALQRHDFSWIQNYGKTHIAQRQTALNNLSKQVKNYHEVKLAQAVARNNKAVTDFYGSNGLPARTLEQPQTSRDVLTGDIDFAQRALDNGTKNLNASNTKTDAANAVCDAISNSSVYGYLKAKFSAYAKVEALYVVNTDSNNKKLAVIEAVKANKVTAAKVGLDRLNKVDPEATKLNLINPVAQRVLAVTRDNYTSKSFQDAFLNFKPSYDAAKTTVNADAQVVNAVFKKAKSPSANPHPSPSRPNLPPAVPVKPGSAGGSG